MYRLTQSDAVIRLTDMAFIPADPANSDWAAYEVWLDAGGVPEPVPAPSVDDVKAALSGAVQGHMDAAAKAAGYDDIKSAVTYADEPAVAKFQQEGQSFREWRSLVWAACYGVMADVEAGYRDVPTAQELIAELPLLELPA